MFTPSSFSFHLQLAGGSARKMVLMTDQPAQLSSGWLLIIERIRIRFDFIIAQCGIYMQDQLSILGSDGCLALHPL